MIICTITLFPLKLLPTSQDKTSIFFGFIKVIREVRIFTVDVKTTESNLKIMVGHFQSDCHD